MPLPNVINGGMRLSVVSGPKAAAIVRGDGLAVQIHPSRPDGNVDEPLYGSLPL